MNTSTPLNNFAKPHLGKNWGLVLLWGILLLILGLLAISAAMFTTILSMVLLGAILAIGGAIIIIDAFTNWWGRWGGFFLHLAIGILYCAVGLTLIQNPIWGSISLTFMLGIFYIILGLFRVIYSLAYKVGYRGWSLFSGIISIIVGALILASWPASSLYIIGLFIGIDLLFGGWAYIMAALFMRANQTR